MKRKVKMTGEDYQCHDCDMRFRAPEELHLRVTYRCPKCLSENWGIAKNRPNLIKPAVDQKWRLENGGRGRCFTQFLPPKGVKPGDPRCARYFRSQREAIEAAKAEGYAVEKAR
jgi:DNA-directed RNA polymerase subunit RPC12/RpoP